MRRISKIIVHCSDSTFGNVELIDRWHKERGWRCIGYHFVITNGLEYTSKVDSYDVNKDGVIQEGRDIVAAGAHAAGHNKNSIGVCLIGKTRFTIRQLQALISLTKVLMSEFPSVNIERILGHNELGSYKTCPNFDVGLVRLIHKSFVDFESKI